MLNFWRNIKISSLLKKLMPDKEKNRLRPLWKKCLIWTVWSVLFFHGFVILTGAVFAVAYKFINPPYSAFMLYRMVFDDQKIYQNKFVPVNKLPRSVSRMLVSVEDGNFYTHCGIDFKAIETARKRNEKAGYNKFGGSTITQQLVKTLFLVPDKFLVRKYIEIIFALEFDLFMDKTRIMELYLNNVEWGPGIFGIEAAAIHHFNKHAVSLSRDESARLIAILPNPLKYNVNNFTKKRAMSFRYNRLIGVIPNSTDEKTDADK